MAIERLGYDTVQVGWTTPYSFSVNIPATTNAIVLFITGYDFNASGASLGAQSFILVNESTVGGSNDDVCLMYCMSPALTGAQTISISFSSAHGNNSRVYAVYYNGVDTSSIRDSDIVDGYSLTFSTQSGDRVILGASADASLSWTNASEIYSGAAGAVTDTSVADMTADSTSETISCTNSNTGLSGIVLIPAASSSGNPWYYYAQQLRSLKDKWRRLMQIPSLEEVKLYGRTRYA